MYRYERKYYISSEQYDFVRTLVLNHPAQFREIFHPRIVNNIYFDTPGFDFFYDNINGHQTRKKIRIRWYGETFSQQKKLSLEIKLKNGLLGNKLTYSLEDIYTGKDFEIRTLKTELKSSYLPLDIEHELQMCYPTLLNKYFRSYFISDDNKFRITLDRDLSFFRIHAGKNNFNSVCNNAEVTIMEMKYNPENENTANSISDFFPFRITKCSKYVSGIQSLYSII